ncbi:MAG: LEA type 2 family protein [Gammaproteobacteria bacterium]|nr:LEA type 2 family protein [Gammaproteobacteria bacterium]NND60362.1 LEA type 2 family protein [Gammaproteobacteria bacterium]
MSNSEKQLTFRVLAVLAVVLVIVSLAGCATLEREVQQPQVRLANIVFLEGGLREQVYGITLEVDNPNGFPLPVKTVNYVVNLADKQFASGATSSPFSIPANGTDQVQLEVRTNLIESFSHLRTLLQGGVRELEYNMSGDVQINLPLVSAIPFSQTGTIPLRMQQ